MDNSVSLAGQQFPAGSERLLGWLKDPAWSLPDFADILNGTRVPASYSHVEPYEWIIDVLLDSGNPVETRRELAVRLALFLDRSPEFGTNGTPVRKSLFNALSLCASIHHPWELAPALRRMYTGRFLQGDWDGISLRGRLRAAIAGNQQNWDWQDTWIRMANGQSDKSLPGTRYNGFDAVLLMPILNDELPLHAIGESLTGIVHHLEREKDRESRLLETSDRIRQTFQAGQEVVGYLLLHAFGSQWPLWAIRVLTSKLSCRWCAQDIDDAAEESLRTGEPKAYAIQVAGTLEDEMKEHTPRAARLFSAIKKRELDALNVGAQVEVCV